MGCRTGRESFLPGCERGALVTHTRLCKVLSDLLYLKDNARLIFQ